MICNCTLAGTDACTGCPNNLVYKPNLNKIKTIYINNTVKEEKSVKGFPVIQYWCSQCDALLNKYDKYCHNCGVEIDWEMITED